MPVSWRVFAPQGSDNWVHSCHFKGNPLRRVSKQNSLFLIALKERDHVIIMKEYTMS